MLSDLTIWMKFVIWDFYLHVIIKYIYPFLVESIVKKFLINMLTKKDLLEAIEDMPMDSKFCIITSDGRIAELKLSNVICDVKHNMIGIC